MIAYDRGEAMGEGAQAFSKVVKKPQNGLHFTYGYYGYCYYGFFTNHEASEGFSFVVFSLCYSSFQCVYIL